jgi:long-chain acyl-CoA synthetase
MSVMDQRFTLRHEIHYGSRLVRCYALRPASVHDLFSAALVRGPEREALSSPTERLTYGELDQRAARVAGLWRARGLGRGDRVVLMVSNRMGFVIAFLAAQRLGAVTVPVSIRESADGLAFILEQCKAKALVHDAALADRVAAPETHPGLLCVDTETLEALSTQAGSEVTPVSVGEAARVAEDDVACLLYTSGTTGRPKGAMLTHFGIVHSCIHYQQVMALGDHERSILAVPASHVTGLVAMITTMWHVGGSLTLMPEFKAAHFLEVASRERITHTMLVPAMYALCLLQPQFASTDLSAWRIGSYGGAPMPQATIEALAGTVPGLTLMNAYGATETSSPATLMPRGEQAAHLDSVGQPLPCVDIIVVDDEGCEVAPGETGELMIAGPCVVPGYWDNPEATAREFIGGYWRSGDLGSKDAEGFVRIFDRKKDMINRGDYKIWSVEVENTLAGYPGVIEAAAIGVPCPVLGERVHAFVHTTQPAPDPEVLRAWCAERLADYKVPEAIGLRSEPLPRNANGKLMKRTMREWTA